MNDGKSDRQEYRRRIKEGYISKEMGNESYARVMKEDKERENVLVNDGRGVNKRKKGAKRKMNEY